MAADAPTWMWTYETLPLGVEALRVLAVETACMQAAIPRDEAGQSSQQRADKAMIESMFTGIHDMFWPFMSSMPAPGDFERLITDLKEAARALHSAQPADTRTDLELDPGKLVFDGAKTVSDHLSTWSGAAAREFKAKYLDPLPTQTAGIYNAIMLTVELVRLERGVWEGVRTDITQILNDAIDTLRNMPGWCGKDSLNTVLTTVAGLATIAAVPLSPLGTSLAVGLAVLDGTASVGATLLPDDPKKFLRFPAPNAYGVIIAVERAIAELYARINEQEHKIARFFDSAAAVISREHDSYIPPLPMLAGATQRNVTGQDYMGFSS